MAGPISTPKTRVYIAPYTDESTATEYDALPWERIGTVLDVGEFGPQYQEITYTPLDDGIVHRLKGALDNGSIPLILGRDPDNAGQADLLSALPDYDNYAFKIELNDKPSGAGAKPTRFMFPGKAMSYRTQIGDANQIVRANVNIAIDGDIVTGARGT